MSGDIVSEGVVAQNGGGGTLFKDLKFWVGYKVPHRTTCIQNIEANGGKVVPLEKNADYLISNPTKKFAPPGSYSFQLIKDALEEGSLARKDDYLCTSPAAPPGASSAARSASATAKGPKMTRNKFTPEDDKILTQYVIQKEREGVSTAGLAIYQDFEAQHPHHTHQSWRDRWVKRLKFLPRPASADGEPSPARPTQPGQPTSLPPSPPAWQLPAAPARPSSTQSPGSARTRAGYTQEEDNVLIAHVRECIRQRKPISGNKVYIDLAGDFPHHSWQSWRDRWLKHVCPAHKSQVEQWKDQAQNGLLLSDYVSPSKPTIKQPKPNIDKERASQTRKPEKLAEVDRPQQDATPVPRPVTATPHPRAATNPDRNETQSEMPDPHQPPQSSAEENLEPRDEPEPEPETDHVGRDNGHAPTSHSSPAIPESETSYASQTWYSNENQFYRDYRLYLENADVHVTPWPSIRGRVVELWDLWRAVQSTKMLPEERDWQQIAENLGFNWIEWETVPDELRQCYQDNLAGFENTLLDFEDTDNEEEGQDDDDAPAATEEPLPSSPPIPSLKRSFGAANNFSDHSYPQSPHKRRRLDRNGEVPSTPDEKNGTSPLRPYSDLETTPTAKRSTVALYPDLETTPTANRSFVATGSMSHFREPHQPNAGVQDDDDETRDELQELPAMPRTRKRIVEPETQDFGFDPETQRFAFDEAEEESQMNITPSQQLQQESDARSSEIPDDFEPPHTGTKSQRVARNPFLRDESGEESEGVVRPRNSGPPSASLKAAQPIRRSLPKTWVRKASQTKALSKTPAPQPKPQASPQRSPEPGPSRAPTPIKDKADEIIDRFLSLGYPNDIVVRALKATTWHIGNAGHVMEILKRGEGLPQRTSGVWTQRDDESLLLVDSKNPPKAVKEEKKRAKELKRLQAKHGPEMMAKRRLYLTG
ncbi:Uu.00g129680.m01.CDS01 [Anthostomella pinea]|uniref:DNA-binding protein RAP1 n=1 Tax=Anthostomella pinea TaxID=933095 RepID=A0AAI8VJN8_9PEZI|nr:Uu.00g129680.m01.CDS01 [Anthostomella pinea]